MKTALLTCKVRTVMRRTIWLFLLFSWVFLSVPLSHATREDDESELTWLWRKKDNLLGKDLGEDQDPSPIKTVGIANLLQQICWWDGKAREYLQNIIDMERGIRQTALNMSKNLNLSSHASLMAGESSKYLTQSTFTSNPSVPGDLKVRMQECLDKVYTIPFTDDVGNIEIGQDRKTLIASFKTSTVPASYQSLGRNPWLIKVSQTLPPADNPRVLEDILNEAAKALLPEKLFRSFRADKFVGEVLKQAGVVSVSSNGLLRASVPQDEVFIEFGNIDCDGADQALFWSDPMVSAGYHPAFGLALNATPLRGCKSVDMDNIVSHGLSQTIDHWNYVQSPERRVINPFKGYAARVIPGLIMMGEQGRLVPREYPTPDQFIEAAELTKKVKMLPSQFLKGKMQASYKLPFNYACRGGVANSRQVIFVGGSATASRWLDSFDKSMYDKIMSATLLRLRGNMDTETESTKQVRGLIPAMAQNEAARNYVNEILASYKTMETSAASLASGMDNTNAIPQITQLRQAILSSAERWRGQLSDLWHQYSELKQQEWQILDSIVQTNEKYITILMEQGSVGANTDAVKAKYK